ncbi:hypothetical protein [Priestia megaterium]|uniref:hypothetical protein n=1 Tax=Priestia megaterium TaxID=1404 RepID=UPI00112BB9D5|nr:hypothetical protein [Priestia megaterium]TPF18053.1 hypothetical protein CBE78_02160 [Priestia megaterium]TPF22160.1 hypothetical protein CBE79_04665 [Priestia megaterium]
MAIKKKTIEDLYYIVENEGLGYAVADYVNPDTIENDEMRKIWIEADEALKKVQKILDKWEEENEDE